MKFKKQIVRITVLFSICLFSTLNSFSQTSIYIDSIVGNDANTGTLALPYKTITKLNTMTLAAGTNVYLKSGCTWSGQKLKFKGSGTAISPIIIDKYGTGATPLLAGNGLTGEAVVYLYNQQYIEINNLEITNSPNGPKNSDFFIGLYSNGTNPLGADRRGVMVAIDNYGTANHIYLKNLNIHHIKGQLGNGTTTLNGAIPKRTGGIFFTVLGNTEKTSSNSRFNDVLIDSCNVNYCENTGIALDNEWNVYYPGSNEYNKWFSRRFSNIHISNNIVHHIGKNAMIIRCTDSTGLIERNVCYETALGTTGNTMFSARARGTVFQYNEGYNNRATTQTVDPGNIDGSMYDPDFGSINVVFQYSYSHDNSQGLYWGCNTRSSTNNTSGVPDPEDAGCTARYNISENDLGDLVFFNYPSAGNEIYNNVFYIKSGLKPNIIHENGGNNHTYTFRNNIIYNLSSANSGADYVFDNGTTNVHNRTITYNTFFGNHHSTEPFDSFKLTTNPLFVNPGKGANGINTLSGYKLQSGSPCINSGFTIPNNGGFDFWGNKVPAKAGDATDRGAFEFPAIPVPVRLVSFKANAENKVVSLIWYTENEINNAGFQIERSKDGVAFEAIGFLKASITTNGQYRFIDEHPISNITFYRLKQMDNNGAYTFSSIVAINILVKTAQLNVFPNPIKKGTQQLQLQSNLDAGTYPIKITNEAGKYVFSNAVYLNQSQSTLLLPKTLTKGIYWLQIVSGNVPVITRFIVE